MSKDEITNRKITKGNKKTKKVKKNHKFLKRFLLLLLIIINLAHPLFRKVFDEYDHLNNVVSENLNGIRVVKSISSTNTSLILFADTLALGSIINIIANIKNDIITCIA